MEKKILGLRRTIQQRKRWSQGRGGYGAKLRAAVLELAAEWRSSGRSQRDLAGRLGLNSETLARWCRTTPTPATRTVRVIDVVEDDPDPASTHTALLPSGVRVEGLSMADIAELARRLS
jgi:hypothetical protein